MIKIAIMFITTNLTILLASFSRRDIVVVTVRYIAPKVVNTGRHDSEDDGLVRMMLDVQS